MLNPSFQQRIEEVHGETGRVWLSTLPERLRGLEESWGLRVGPPVENLTYNFVASAELADGTPAMVKLGVPGEAIAREIAAFRYFNGRSSVGVLAADPELGALLLERLSPGRSLLRVPDDVAIPIVAAVIRRLHRPAPPDGGFPTTTDWARAFSRLRIRFEGGTGPLSLRLVETAEILFHNLGASAPPPVLLHGDLHHDNVLSAQREPWLAIDPHGVIGDPVYEVGAFLRNDLEPIATAASPGREMSRRVDHFAAELDFDRERIRSWALAQAVLSAVWSLEDHDAGWEEAIACAEWLSAAR